MKTKTCSKCKNVKALDHFGKRTDGYYKSWCRDCLNKYKAQHRKTKYGCIKVMYYNQKQSSIRRNHNPPEYTFKELNDWILSQVNWEELYRNWVESGYDRWEKPSVDRLDDNKGYSFGNIRLVTWRENDKKAHIDERNGKLISGNKHRPVIQLTKEGEFVAEYHSISHAQRQTNIENVSSVCIGKRNYAGGYKWKHKEVL